MTNKQDGSRKRRAESFANVADSYERARPGYPHGAITWMLGSADRVLDLGAGTGKLTRDLVAHGYKTVAVEPLPEMVAELRRAVPTAETLIGRAEAIPLPDKDVDAVVVAQAFHWFETSIALAEIARVLQPRGRLGLLWNIPRPDAELVYRLSPIAGGLSSRPPEIAEPIRNSGAFEELEETTFPHQHVLGRDEILMLASSWSHFASIPPAERTERLAEVGAVFDQLSNGGRVSFPYITYAYRTRRSSA